MIYLSNPFNDYKNVDHLNWITIDENGSMFGSNKKPYIEDSNVWIFDEGNKAEWIDNIGKCDNWNECCFEKKMYENSKIDIDIIEEYASNSHIAEGYDWVAINKDGSVHLFSNEPYLDNRSNRWSGGGNKILIDSTTFGDDVGNWKSLKARFPDLDELNPFKIYDVPSEYEYMAIDDDGLVYAFSEKPTYGGGVWVAPVCSQPPAKYVGKYAKCNKPCLNLYTRKGIVSPKETEYDYVVVKEESACYLGKEDHYTKGGMTVKEVAEAYMSKEHLEGAYKFNVIKYMLRSDHKESALKDYVKARDYLNWLIESMEK